ncbi:YidC/Oxa1 family membrane protein insertase [Candidatus Roizmanbacteria bacterium]|nr:MAG: YidC/Oxa1 family membrane protein insertase [Candidatus Roizmanbacteria bacterium]
MPQFLIDFFNLIFIQPVTNALVVFYDIFVRIGLPGAFGFAIIAITVLIRLLMHPFFRQQLDTAKKMKEIKPHLDALQKKHKKDPQTLQKEQMRIYQEAGINPAAGCLFAILQIPLIYGLYHTLQLFLTNDKDGKIVREINDKLYHPALTISQIDPNFFVYNLALSPAQSGLWYYYLVPVITAVLQYFQSKVTMPQMDEPKKTDSNELKKKDAKEEPSTADEFQRAMGTQMKYIFPVMIGYFSYTLPLGLSLYWNTFSLFSIIQHYIDERKAKSVTK